MVYGTASAVFREAAPFVRGRVPVTRRTFMMVLAGLGLVPQAAARTARAGQRGEPAPDVAGGPWLNSPPLTLAALQGQVVLVEFWTYG